MPVAYTLLSCFYQPSVKVLHQNSIKQFIILKTTEIIRLLVHIKRETLNNILQSYLAKLVKPDETLRVAPTWELRRSSPFSPLPSAASSSARSQPTPLLTPYGSSMASCWNQCSMATQKLWHFCIQQCKQSLV